MLGLVENCVSVILESNLRSAEARSGLTKFDDNRQIIPLLLVF